MNIDDLSPGLRAICRFQKTDSVEVAIRGICSAILKQSEIEQPPVALKPLLSALNVRYSWSNSFNQKNRERHGTASLNSVDGNLTISLNTHHIKNWRRDRFSIAHELTHAIIIRTLRTPELIETLDESKTFFNQLEKVCNLGAAEILMPTKMIRSAIRHTHLNSDSLLSLYDLFLVSRDALIWRLAQMMPGTSVIRWRNHARNSGEPKCLRVVACYPSYEKGGNRPWLPIGATTKHIIPNAIETIEIDSLQEVTIELSGKSISCEAIITSFKNRSSRSNRPLFQGMEIPDDEYSGSDLILFVRNISSTRSTWFEKIT